MGLFSRIFLKPKKYKYIVHLWIWDKSKSFYMTEKEFSRFMMGTLPFGIYFLGFDKK